MAITQRASSFVKTEKIFLNPKLMSFLMTEDNMPTKAVGYGVANDQQVDAMAFDLDGGVSARLEYVNVVGDNENLPAGTKLYFAADGQLIEVHLADKPKVTARRAKSPSVSGSNHFNQRLSDY